jgi:hypothetical protein
MGTFGGCVIVGLVMGLAWAVRGHFGHEHGAAWAGALGAMAVLVVARRRDWLRRLPVLCALAAVGWGAGGMMSYGRIVGYGRGTDFANVFYGLGMLFVVGGLYGFLGGGLFGLGLGTSTEKRPDWPRVITEMVAGAILIWCIVIYQLAWYMTPPRSELWAACLGAALALTWYLQRNGHHAALRTAWFAAVGAGIGFSGGNFVQTVGNAAGVAFNWWNAMEFSLGFAGGIGMAFGVLKSEWDGTCAPSPKANALGIAFLLLAIPATNVIQALEYAPFKEMGARLEVEDPAAFATNQVLLGWLVVAVCCAGGCALWRSLSRQADRTIHAGAILMLAIYSAEYLVLGHLKKGYFYAAGAGQLEHYLYRVVLAVALVLLIAHRRLPEEGLFRPRGSIAWREWIYPFMTAVALIAVLALISVRLHSGLAGAHTRF